MGKHKRRRKCPIVVEEQEDVLVDHAGSKAASRTATAATGEDVTRAASERGGLPKQPEQAEGAAPRGEKTRKQQQTTKPAVHRGISDSSVGASVSQLAAAQAAEFLAELEQSVGVALGGFAGLAEPRGCTGFRGARAEPCASCRRPATVHQLRLQQRPADLRPGPSLLGRTA